VTIICDATQRLTFKTLFNITLQRGALPFDWVDPVSRANRTFRFRKPAPKWSQRGAAYMCSFALERVA
jgi:hypothetical protein